MASITRFVSNFFNPPPKTACATVAKKTGAQHVIDYLDSSSGVWDFSRVCELFFSYLHSLPILSDSNRLRSEKISGVFAVTGAALSLPQLVVDIHAWVSSFSHLFSSAKLSEKDPSRQARVTHAAKKALINTSNLGNTFTQALIFFNESKLVNLAKQMPVVNFFFNSTSLLSDGVECVQEAKKVSKYMAKLSKGVPLRKVERWQGKLKLAWMKIAQASSSVAMAVIGLGALAAGVAVTSLPILSSVSLGLLTVWLTSKISSYFYEKILEERRLTAI